MEYLFLLGRILLGGFFIMNGYKHFKHLAMMTGYAQSKGVQMPREAIILTGLMLLLGGAGIVLGVYIELSVLLLVLFLLGTLIKIHTYWTMTDPMAKMSENIQFHKNLALIGALLMLLSIPVPWMMSLM